jgi:amino acid transporter
VAFSYRQTIHAYPNGGGAYIVAKDNIGPIAGLIAVGAWRALTGTITPVIPAGTPAEVGVNTLGVFLVLRAFSNGCTAMTGVEAVSNGVPAFKPPEAKNAATTLVIMPFLCVTLFLGVTLLAHAYRVVPLQESVPGYETVVSQIARGVFGGRGAFYYAVQAQCRGHERAVSPHRSAAHSHYSRPILTES